MLLYKQLLYDSISNKVYDEASINDINSIVQT